MFTKTTIGLFVFAATLAPWPMVAHSQTVYWAPPGPPVAATPQISVALSPQQVNQLAAPIALYPDPLLAEMLPASTYPWEVVEAARWLAAYPNPSGIMIDLQTWDPSVKALLHYPTVLGYMSDNLAWTEALGVAFLNQQQDVMQAIQQLRALALAAGTLQTTAQQQIILQGGDIYIEPVNPQLLYVPEYNPNVVYSAPAVGIPAGLSLLVSFSRGWQIGAWLDNDCDWGPSLGQCRRRLAAPLGQSSYPAPQLVTTASAGAKVYAPTRAPAGLVEPPSSAGAIPAGSGGRTGVATACLRPFHAVGA